MKVAAGRPLSETRASANTLTPGRPSRAKSRAMRWASGWPGSTRGVSSPGRRAQTMDRPTPATPSEREETFAQYNHLVDNYNRH